MIEPSAAETPWQPECYGCLTRSHGPAYDHGVFPWTCPDHGFFWMGYGVSTATVRKLGGPHQHRCPRCEGWINCRQWPNGCPPGLPVSNVPKLNAKDADE